MKTATRIAILSEPEMALMSQRSRDLQAKGLDVINLSIGEPDFPAPEHIKRAAMEAVQNDYSHYAPIPGYPDLRKAIAEKLQRENGLNYQASQVVISNGAKQALSNVILSLVNPGDEVIIPTPYWATYIEMVKLADGKSVIVKTGIGQSFKMTPAQLEAAITPKTKALLLNSPSNPSGVVYTAQELEQLAAVLRKHPQIMVISDEIYELISFTDRHNSIATLPGMQERTIIINGVSKGFAMTGWRIGYSASCTEVAEACIKIQSQQTSAACSVAQRAALAAYTHPLDASFIMRDAFQRRRDLMVKLAQAIPGLKLIHPDGAFYLFPDVSHYFGQSDGKTTINNATDLSMYLLDQALVATVTGEAFGEPDCLRISYAAADAQLVTAMGRIGEALGRLRGMG
jgi:aspartate aminotransferase